MASYNHFVTDPYAVLTIQLTMLFIYSGFVYRYPLPAPPANFFSIGSQPAPLFTQEFS